MKDSVKKRIITIAGQPGSGKSTNAKLVAAQLGYNHFSSGDLFRALASERGINLMEANLSAEQNSELDHLVDGRLRELGVSGDQLVIDSRTAWHWMPASFKVYLDLDLNSAARRILNAIDAERTENEEVHHDYVKYAGMLQARLDSESRRYKQLYNIDPYTYKHYDLVVDTKNNTIEETVSIIIDAYQKHIN